jgi:ATP-dependent Clp protease adapter protein ClpS
MDAWLSEWFGVVGPIWLLVLLVAAWRYRSRRASAFKHDQEVEVVIVAATSMMVGRTARITTAHLARAALCNPDVAAAFARCRASLEHCARHLDAQIAELGVSPAVVQAVAQGRASPPVIVADALADAYRRAAVLAQARGDSEFAIGDLMNALAAGDDEVGLYLKQLAVDFDDTLLASSLHGDTDEVAFVYLWNDPLTPMDAVVDVVRTVFGADDVRATYIMFSVHRRGVAAIGPLGKDEASRLLARARSYVAELGVALTLSDAPPDTTDWRQTERGLLP